MHHPIRTGRYRTPKRIVALLKDRSWFDIPIVYTNGVRAVLAMEKGSHGARTFAEVFAAWEKK
jgi:hypothetical protein